MYKELLSTEDLSISFPNDDQTGRVTVVSRISFDLERGGTLGVVGESGSGKTMIGRAILNLLPTGGRVDGGKIDFDGIDLLALSKSGLRAIRGKRIGMIFQEPMTSLNPSLTIGRQMTEGLILHHRLSRDEAEKRSLEMLEKVQISNPRGALEAYPHVFSGGMRQRIMLASVLMLEPDILIADEPTTALDAIIQKDVMDLMMALVQDLGSALILISHDLPMVAKYADRVIVMQLGSVVETGSVSNVIADPGHSYTEALLDALPRRGPTRKSNGAGEPVLAAVNVSVGFQRSRKWPWAKRQSLVAVDDVSLTIRPSEIVGLVGESGSGKTTFGRAILDLVPVLSGSVDFEGRSRQRGDEIARTDMQIIFQDPYSSLDPRMSVYEIVLEALRHDHSSSIEKKRSQVDEILATVQLPVAEYGDRFPHELSGGQRQRVCIARAVVGRPRFVVADEPVSALDLTVQKEILSLFKNLQEKFGFSALFISHDIAVVEEIADRIAVMYRGRIVEEGEKSSFFANPTHPYTRRLLSAVPEIVVDEAGKHAIRNRHAPAVPPPDGCDFAAPDNNRDEIVYHAISPGHHVAVVQQS